MNDFLDELDQELSGVTPNSDDKKEEVKKETSKREWREVTLVLKKDQNPSNNNSNSNFNKNNSNKNTFNGKKRDNKVAQIGADGEVRGKFISKFP